MRKEYKRVLASAMAAIFDLEYVWMAGPRFGGQCGVSG